MPSEFEAAQEPKDRSLWLWLGVAVLFVAMVVALYLMSQRPPDTTAVYAKHILITFNTDDPMDRAAALDLITSLQERILNGESFETLAEQYSQDPISSARGGALGPSSKGELEAAFEQYVWNGPVGELSDVVVTSFGFHLIKVEQRHISKADRYEMELDQRAREALEKEKDGGGP